MLQIANIRKNSQELAERLAIRGLDGDALMSSVLEMDERNRSKRTEMESLQAKGNQITSQIGELYKSGQKAEGDILKLQSVEIKDALKQLESDVLIKAPKHGDLTNWSREGVLLLNTILTVSENSPLSHQKLGWERFVEKILTVLSSQNPFVVFVLWGKSAQVFSRCVDESKHLLIVGVHPSPLSAHRGFLGSKPFSKINKALLVHG